MESLFPLRSESPLPSARTAGPRVDLPVRGLDLALQGGLLVRCAGFGELFMQGEHLLHQGDHAIRKALWYRPIAFVETV